MDWEERITNSDDVAVVVHGEQHENVSSRELDAEEGDTDKVLYHSCLDTTLPG
jgi:hypothetical protein